MVAMLSFERRAVSNLACSPLAAHCFDSKGKSYAHGFSAKSSESGGEDAPPRQAGIPEEEFTSDNHEYPQAGTS
jgi:hypothetical protein